MVQVHPPLPPPFSITSTIPDALDLALDRVLVREAPAAGERWLVAFSGGADSTALAVALAPLATARGLAVFLAHVDHGIDSGSTARAEDARALAARIGLDFRAVTIDVPGGRRRRESPEAAARRLRYAALDSLRLELGATRLLTAHQRDDQIETVLLKLLRGAAIERLGGIARRRGALLRPLLDVSRSSIEARLAAEGLDQIVDPTNEDLAQPRNRVRHRLLPALRDRDSGLDEALLALTARADALRHRLAELFSRRLQDKTETSIEGRDGRVQHPHPEFGPSADPVVGRSEHEPLLWTVGLPAEAAVRSVEARFLTDLPDALQPPALRWLLTEELDTSHLPSLPSMRAFLSLVGRGQEASLRLPGQRKQLIARRGALAFAEPESPMPPFTYTFSLPGEVELPELGLSLRIRRSPVEPWMLRGARTRVGFTADAVEATVRSRRSGDRLRPLGAPGSRKLKAVLVDRGVPAAARDRLPLIEIAGELAWIPGVTIGDRFALRGEEECWLAELEPLAADATAQSGGTERTTKK